MAKFPCVFLSFMKTLFLCLGSYIVKDTTGSDADNFDRQFLYALALTRLSQIAPAGTSILVAENTASSIEQLHPHLQTALRLPQITEVLFSQNNQGQKNKGAGEYGMCLDAFEKKRELFEQADWIVYYTHRHVLSFPQIFSHLERYSAYDAIVSNAPFLYPDRPQNVPDEGVFHDVIFAMKRPVFERYLKTMDPEVLTKKRMSSEKNLYDFLVNEKINYKRVESFGLLRYDYMTNIMHML